MRAIRSFVMLVVGVMLLAAAPALTATYFAEAESFTVTGDGWQKDQSKENWEVVSLQKRASRAAALFGATGAVDSTASTRLAIPKDGQYRLHVRYMQGPWRGPFHVEIVQGGRTVTGKDFDLEAVKGVDNWDYLWDAFDATLTAGEATIIISKYKKQNSTGYARYVDCVLLTDDLTLKPDHVPYGPQIFMRVTLGDVYEKPVYIHFFADHYRDPWYNHFAISKDGLNVGISPKSAKAFFTKNEQTGWVNITSTVYPDSGALLLISARHSYTDIAPRFKARIDFAPEPDEKKIVKTITRDASPGVVHLIVPPDLSPKNLPRLQTDLDIATATGKIADTMKWPTFGKAPALYPYFGTAYPNGGTWAVDQQVADREWKTLGYFGFANKLWEQIGGLWYLKNDCYSQPDTAKMDSGAKSAADAFAKSGKSVDKIANCMLTDEPTGQPLSHIANCPACTEQFRLWLKELHPTPQELGVATWDEVKPVEESQRDKTPALYYYSQRFRTRALSKFFRAQRERLQQAYGSTAFPVNANFSDGATYNANFYSQGVDYFELLESDDQNSIWGENWANGAASPQCSTYNVELMRSAAMKRKQTVGHYLIAYAGRLPWDIQLNAISQAGRDVKMMSTFWYGPSWSGHEGGPPWRNSSIYSHPETWFANASLVRQIGGAEDLLNGAKKRKAEVAMLYASSSDIWALNRTFSYGFDRMFTWLALAHGQVPVDFISEKSVGEGNLQGYKVCYFSGRNLTRAAAAKLAEWVNAGGTLVVTAGAGTHDEFNRPVETVTALLPVTWGKIDEFQQFQGSGSALPSLKAKEQAAMAQGQASFDVLSVKAALQPKPGATVLGTYADGTPAVATGAVGKGTVQAYGFLPGLAYMWPALMAKQQLTADISKQGAKEASVPDAAKVANEAELLRRSWCPWKYPAGVREALLAPALLAKVELPVQCNVPLVDAACMDADKGLVVTLANYTLQPQKAVTLGVASAKKVQRVEAVRAGKLQFSQQKNRVTITLPLGESDIVKLYY